MKHIPAVLQPSSTCQWFRLLRVRCQRFTHQPIVFCVVRPTHISLGLAMLACEQQTHFRSSLLSLFSDDRKCVCCSQARLGYAGSLWARSIQPKFPKISVQNYMDRFGPNGKVSKKRVHLLRWTTFPGLTGWNFGWMDRALSFFFNSRTAALVSRVSRLRRSPLARACTPFKREVARSVDHLPHCRQYQRSETIQCPGLRKRRTCFYILEIT